MKTTWLFLLAWGLIAVNKNNINAQERQDRQENQNLRKLDRQSSRMANRADYWSKETWPQVEPWIQQYKTRTIRPAQETARRVENATERATERKVNDAQRAAFGFNNADTRFSDDVWFYDYYTYWPSYFMSTGDTATDYASSVRFFDYDNDGVYESTSAYRDSDKDGRFDEYDRYDFTATETENPPDYSPNDAKRYTVSGKVRSKRTSMVNDSEHVIVRVAQDDVTSVIVDLGATERWTEVEVEAGSMIKATGPMERIGEKNVLVAESVSVGEKPIRVEPSSPRYSGKVLEVKKFKVKDADHTLAVIETSDGNELVDLGPSEALKVDVVANEKIDVYGVPVRIHDHQVVMASRFDFGDKTFTVTRWK